MQQKILFALMFGMQTYHNAEKMTGKHKSNQLQHVDKGTQKNSKTEALAIYKLAMTSRSFSPNIVTRCASTTDS